MSFLKQNLQGAEFLQKFYKIRKSVESNFRCMFKMKVLKVTHFVDSNRTLSDGIAYRTN